MDQIRGLNLRKYKGKILVKRVSRVGYLGCCRCCCSAEHMAKVQRKGYSPVISKCGREGPLIYRDSSNAVNRLLTRG